MKVVKISHLLNCTLEDFLDKVGATRAKIGYPTFVHISDRDAAILKRNNRRKFRKESRYASKSAIDNAIGLYWLQYGPNEWLSKGIKPGYALVDLEGIDAQRKQDDDVYFYKEEDAIVKAPPTLRQRLYDFVTLNWI